MEQFSEQLMYDLIALKDRIYTTIIDHEDVFCVSNEYLKQLGNNL